MGGYGRRGVVLVVDEDESVVGWLAETIRLGLGARVVTESRGTHALHWARVLPFDAVITEFVYSRGGGGIDYCEELRRLAGCAVIVASSACLFEPVTALLDSRGFPWLAKPFSVVELLAALRRHLPFSLPSAAGTDPAEPFPALAP